MKTLPLNELMKELMKELIVSRININMSKCTARLKTRVRFGLTLFILSAGMHLGAQNPEANLPAQPVGSGDLLAISVYGSPELTRTVRVGEDGRIRLPMVKDSIEARGLMPAELEERIVTTLEDAQVLVDPVVTVSIAEYHSHPIGVSGAVKNPLTFQAPGTVRLLEALGRAQGLSETAGPEILVTRMSAGGTTPTVDRIPVQGLIDAADPAWNIELHGGEQINVPEAGRVYVVGNVKRPGAFRAEEGAQGSGTTVLRALALAEGLAPFASRDAYVLRPRNGGREEIPVPLGKIMDRKAPDMALSPNDIFYIPDSRSRRVAVTAIERALGFAASTTSGILILGSR